MSSSDSSFSVESVSTARDACATGTENVPSTLASSAGASAAPASAAPAAAPAAGAAPPPEPTFRSRSLTSLPSRACPISETVSSCVPSLVDAHLGEKGSPDGLDLLDLCGLDQGLELVGLRILVSDLRRQLHLGDRTVMSTPSSARMRAA